jgi:hypothetical protein
MENKNKFVKKSLFFVLALALFVVTVSGALACTTLVDSTEYTTDIVACTDTYNFANGILIKTSVPLTFDCNGSTINGTGVTNGKYAIKEGAWPYATNVTLKNCIISNFQYGTYFSKNAHNITNNTYINNGQALRLRSTNSYVENNNFTNNTVRGLGLEAGSQGTEVYNNYFSIDSTSSGIVTENAVSPFNQKIHDNNFVLTNGKGSGLVIYNVGTLSAYNNNFTGTWDGSALNYAIRGYGSTNPGNLNIYDNNIFDGFKYGIFLDSNHINSNVTNNYVANVGLWGIATEGNYARVAYNRVYNSSWNNIYFSGNNTYIGYNFVDNYIHHGIDAHSETETIAYHALIEYNNVTKSSADYLTGDCAFFIGSTYNTTVQYNYVYDVINNVSSSSGICIEDTELGDNSIVKHNSLNNVTSLALYDTANNTIWNNNTITNTNGAYAHMISLSKYSYPPKTATFQNNTGIDIYYIGNNNLTLNVEATQEYKINSSGTNFANITSLSSPYNDVYNETSSSWLAYDVSTYALTLANGDSISIKQYVAPAIISSSFNCENVQSSIYSEVMSGVLVFVSILGVALIALLIYAFKNKGINVENISQMGLVFLVVTLVVIFITILLSVVIGVGC